MYPKIKHDQQQIKNILEQVNLHAQRVCSELDSRPAGLKTPPQKISEELNNDGVGALEALQFFSENYASQFSASAGPNYFGLVTGGVTPAAVAGDWLASIYDQNVVGSTESIASAFEVATLHMLRSLFHLDDEFEGSFVSGATMSNFTSLAIARQWLGKQNNVNIAEQGLSALGPIKLFSASPHSSIYKSLSMLGIGKSSMQLVNSLDNREAIDVRALEQALKKHPNPSIVIANAGTVNTVDFDDLIAINSLKQKYNFWLHVDAAFGCFAACSDRYSHLVAGLNFADSITIDAHKWLNVPYDSGMQFSRHLDLQAEVFCNLGAYLRADISLDNFINLTPENSRRFRALPAWFTLMAYGADGYTEIVNRCCDVAAWVSQKIELDPGFELLAPQNLNGICFTLKIDGARATQAMIQKAVQFLQCSGEIYLTSTVYKNQPALRFSVSNWSTEIAHAKRAWVALQNMRNMLEKEKF